MTDIVKRLRLLRNATQLCIEAADEIERLRDALERIATRDYPETAQEFAREALREVGDD